jgi:hypothetical protein
MTVSRRAYMHDSHRSDEVAPAKPTWIDWRFGFSAMQLSAQDIPPVEDCDLHRWLEQIEAQIVTSRLSADRLQRELDAAPRARSAGESAPSGSGLMLSKSDLVELSVQTWRLARRIEGIDGEKLPREKKQLADSLRRFQKILDALKIEVVDPTGQTYAEGWVEVEVVSWEAPEPGSNASVHMVKQCIAPIIRRNGEIIGRGQVVVTEIAH